MRQQTKITTELRQQRAALMEEASALLPADRRATKDELEAYKAKIEQIKELTQEIETREQAAALEIEKFQRDNPPVEQRSEVDKDSWKKLRDRYAEAYWNAMRCATTESEARAMAVGLAGKGTRPSTLSPEDRAVLADPMAINAGAAVSFREFRSLIKNPSFQSAMSDRQRELRDMGIASPTASTPTSVLVPQGFVRDLEVALKYFGGMLEASDYLDTSTGQPLPYPTENDTAISGELISENTQVTAQDLTVSNIIFNAWKYSTKLVKVSLELLQDSAFDLEGVLRDAFAIRLGRILNTHFTNGTGTGQPKGLLVAAPVGPTAVGSSGNTGGTETGGTSIGSDDLIALEHSVDPLYRRQPGAGFMLHDATLAALRKVKDKYGRPLWPQLYDGSAKSINGYPIFINNDMPTIALNATTVAFGALKKYKIRRVKDLAVIRLVERFADYGQVAFIGFARYDGNLLDAGTNPVKLLKQAAA